MRQAAGKWLHYHVNYNAGMLCTSQMIHQLLANSLVNIWESNFLPAVCSCRNQVSHCGVCCCSLLLWHWTQSNMDLASAAIRAAVAWKRWLYREYAEARDNEEYLISLFIQPPSNFSFTGVNCRSQSHSAWFYINWDCVSGCSFLAKTDKCSAIYICHADLFTQPIHFFYFFSN